MVRRSSSRARPASARHLAEHYRYDLNGNVISSFPVRATGERMNVDRIPDQP
jgi:hypothetical protein